MEKWSQISVLRSASVEVDGREGVKVSVGEEVEVSVWDEYFQIWLLLLCLGDRLDHFDRI